MTVGHSKHLQVRDFCGSRAGMTGMTVDHRIFSDGLDGMLRRIDPLFFERWDGT